MRKKFSQLINDFLIENKNALILHLILMKFTFGVCYCFEIMHQKKECGWKTFS